MRGVFSMKRVKKIFFLLLLLLSCNINLFAQDTISKKDTSSIKKHSNVVVKKDTIDLKKTIVINNKIFKVYSNWITAGGGQGYNSALPKPQFIAGLDYNFHIQQYYFQMGLLISGDAFGSYNNNQFHVCYGKRNENAVFNLAYFIGPSYSVIYSDYGYSSTSAFGIYGEAQLIHKLSYDTGIGADIFANANTTETIVGLRIIIYFSGAYQGQKNKLAEKEPTIY